MATSVDPATTTTATSAATTTATSAATTTATSAAAEGPVMSVMTKRVRALRKKLNRITQMEDALSAGKPLNKEQLDVLRSKPTLLALIDELDKLRSPLASALLDEQQQQQLLFHNHTSNSNNTHHHHHHDTNINNNNDNDIGGDDDGVVDDLVKLMYFGSLFDVKQQTEFTSLMLTRTHERGCCLTYDYVTDEDGSDELMLGEKDLDLISSLQGLMVSRPVNAPVSHRNALEKCVEHARNWLRKSDQSIYPDSDVTYAGLREKLNKIMASDYFTATPQMKAPGEVAAAAAVGSFGSFQVPMQESVVVPVEVTVDLEGSAEQEYQETEENAATYEEYGTGEQQSDNVEEFQKDGLEAENPPEVVSVQTDQGQYQNVEGEHDYRNADFKDQQYFPRRGQRGGRGGGGRRGYSNSRGGRGRGGGPYQNGRSQYYDNYYPRNQYNRRGGRGGAGGGGGNYYNENSGAQGNHTQANIGVAS